MGSLVSELCRIAAQKPVLKPKGRIRLRLIAYKDYTGKLIGWDVYHNEKIVWKIFN